MSKSKVKKATAKANANKKKFPRNRKPAAILAISYDGKVFIWNFPSLQARSGALQAMIALAKETRKNLDYLVNK